MSMPRTGRFSSFSLPLLPPLPLPLPPLSCSVSACVRVRACACVCVSLPALCSSLSLSLPLFLSVLALVSVFVCLLPLSASVSVPISSGLSVFFLVVCLLSISVNSVPNLGHQPRPPAVQTLWRGCLCYEHLQGRGQRVAEIAHCSCLFVYRSGYSDSEENDPTWVSLTSSHSFGSQSFTPTSGGEAAYFTFQWWMLQIRIGTQCDSACQQCLSGLERLRHEWGTSPLFMFSSFHFCFMWSLYAILMVPLFTDTTTDSLRLSVSLSLSVCVCMCVCVCLGCHEHHSSMDQF